MLIRAAHPKVSRNHTFLQRNLYEDATLDYNGGFEPDEDPADYLPRNFYIKGVRLA